MTSDYLSADEVAALPAGAPITVTWGGNGPHDYVVTVDRHGGRYATQPEYIGRWMEFYNRLTFVGSERFHTRVTTRYAAHPYGGVDEPCTDDVPEGYWDAHWHGEPGDRFPEDADLDLYWPQVRVTWQEPRPR